MTPNDNSVDVLLCTRPSMIAAPIYDLVAAFTLHFYSKRL